MKKADYHSLQFQDGLLSYINQTLLPFEIQYIVTDDYIRIAESIERLEIRGAPLIGIAAAYAIALSQKKRCSKREFNHACERLRKTRPTAVNLFWAIQKMISCFESFDGTEEAYSKLIDQANAIFNEDVERCDNIAKNGLAIFDSKKTVITHCNTGRLVSAGGGTALYVIEEAFRNNLVEKVFVDETRPLLQGARLTVFELDALGIPYNLISDSMAGEAIRSHSIDLAITGADRIVKNGDTANKIGTFMLALACNYHKIPFYIAAPENTIDRALINGSLIPIEERDRNEVLSIKGANITLPGAPVYNPSFDVTPAELITGIITEKQLYRYPYSF
jgi:methylthioribose-1-phosphate isomerase